MKVRLVGKGVTRSLRTVLLVPALVADMVDVPQDLGGDDIVGLADENAQEPGLVVVLGVHDEGAHDGRGAEGNKDATVQGRLLGVSRDVGRGQGEHLHGGPRVAVVEVVTQQDDADQVTRDGVEDGGTRDGYGGQDTDDGGAPLVGLEHDEHGQDTAQDTEEASRDLEADGLEVVEPEVLDDDAGEQADDRVGHAGAEHERDEHQRRRVTDDFENLAGLDVLVDQAAVVVPDPLERDEALSFGQEFGPLRVVRHEPQDDERPEEGQETGEEENVLPPVEGAVDRAKTVVDDGSDHGSRTVGSGEPDTDTQSTFGLCVPLAGSDDEGRTNTRLYQNPRSVKRPTRKQRLKPKGSRRHNSPRGNQGRNAEQSNRRNPCRQ